MDFGMPTLIENKSLKENIALCNELGLDFIELNMNLPDYQAAKLENISCFYNAAKQAGIYFTIHLDENLNVSDFNNAVANAYLETVKRTIDVAQHLSIPIINMHMHHGVHITLPDKKISLFEQYFDIYMESFERFLGMCEKEIGTSDVKICIENTDGFRSYEKAAIEYMLRNKSFGLTWDIGHSNCSGNVDEEFIMAHEDSLNHFHIHDSLGKKVHMTLGVGEIDLNQRLMIAEKHSCRCVVETKTIESLKDSVHWLRQKNYHI